MTDTPASAGWVTGPNRKKLLEAGLDYLGSALDPSQVFMLNRDKVWWDGERYWVPIQVGLPKEVADRAILGRAEQE